VSSSLTDGSGAGAHGCGDTGAVSGTGVQEGCEAADAGDAVGDHVVESDEQVHARIRHTGEQPHLPQRSRGIEALPP
jgi:hypothetical protein